MAMQVDQVILGCDVSQEWLDIGVYGEDEPTHIDNEREAIDAYLEHFAAAVLGVEATNTFHELLIERALKLGLEVYVIDGYQLSHYREALRKRAKSDPNDAVLIAEFLARHRDSFRPYQPKSPKLRQLWTYLKRRAALVKFTDQLRQSMKELKDHDAQIANIGREVNKLIKRLERDMRILAKALGWRDDLARLRSMPGVGELTALALLVAYRSGHFTHRDPYVAFMGLDVRVRDSGKHKGKRKLTKMGDPEYRRLLHCASMAAVRSVFYKAHYEQLQARGLAKTEGLVIVARKLARLAFALLKNQSSFDPNRFKGACYAT